MDNATCLNIKMSDMHPDILIDTKALLKLFSYDIINLKKKYEMISIRNLINIETNQNIILL